MRRTIFLGFASPPAAAAAGVLDEEAASVAGAAEEVSPVIVVVVAVTGVLAGSEGVEAASVGVLAGGCSDAIGGAWWLYARDTGGASKGLIRLKVRAKECQITNSQSAFGFDCGPDGNEYVTLVRSQELRQSEGASGRWDGDVSSRGV